MQNYPVGKKVNLVHANSRSPNGAVQPGSRHIGFKNKIADTEQTSSWKFNIEVASQLYERMSGIVNKKPVFIEKYR